MSVNHHHLSLLKSVGLFMGSSLFAWRLVDTLHETAYSLAGILLAFLDKGIIMQTVTRHSFYLGGLGIGCIAPSCDAYRAIAESLFDLVIAATISLLLWRNRSPRLLPLLLLGSYALIFESQYIIKQAFAYPEEYVDWFFVIRAGVPPGILAILGIILVIGGAFWLLLLLPLAGISFQDPFWRKLLVLLAGIPLYSLVAVFFQSLFMNGMRFDFIQDLAVSTVLMATTAALHKPMLPWLERIAHTSPEQACWRDILVAFALGAASVIVQLVIFNDPVVVWR
jgi:hypothetical protein